MAKRILKEKITGEYTLADQQAACDRFRGDNAGHTTKWTLKKYLDREHYENNDPYELTVVNGNCLCKEGINELLKYATGNGGDGYLAATAQVIVGTGTGDATPDDNEGTFTNGVKCGMDSNYPIAGTDQKIIFQATYLSEMANQEWAEWGILSKSIGGKLLNRKVTNNGTKVPGQIWALQCSITIS